MFSGSYVQLGWLQRAINYCYDHILSPAFEFVSNLISSILTVFFENALLPILELNFKFTIELIQTVFQNFLYDLLYSVAKLLMWCLDAVENTFRLFGGLDPVYTQNLDGQYVESGSFILTILKSNYIITALLGLIAASFVLCFLVAILATVRAMEDMPDGGKKSKTVSKVLRHTANSLLRLILIPIMALFLVMLGDAILKSIDLATNNDQARVSDIIFTMSTLDAVRTDDNPSPIDEIIGVDDAVPPDHSDAAFYNATTRAAALYDASDEMKKATSDFGLSDKYRKPFYLRETISTGSLKRDVLAVVLQTFDLRKIDFIILIGGTLMFILIFGVLAISMLTRAFDVIILLLVEPFFAAYMPLDEGEHFEKWQETFFGRLVSGYGMVVAVNVYLSVVNLIFSNQVAFFGEGTTPGVVYIVNLIFAMVGGYTIIKAGPVVTSIMSSSAASRETEAVAMGNTLTVSAMRMISTPFRKIGNYFIGKGIDKMSASMGEVLGESGANAGIGISNAFGRRDKTPANGDNTFSKKKGAATDEKDALKDVLKTELKTDLKDELKAESKVELKEKLKAESKAELKEKLKAESKAELKEKLKEKAKSDIKDALSEQLKGDASLVEGLADIEDGIGLLPPEYSFLEAGKVPDPIKNPTGYTYVGQEDAKERQEKKELDELLGAEIDEDALFAAESETGLDLNGDGKISESSNSFSPLGQGPFKPGSDEFASGQKKMDELLGAEIKDDELFGSGEDFDSILNEGADFSGLDSSFMDDFESSFDDNFEDFLKDNDNDNI